MLKTLSSASLMILFCLIDNLLFGKVMITLNKFIAPETKYRKIEANFTNLANGSVLMNVFHRNFAVIEKEAVSNFDLYKNMNIGE